MNVSKQNASELPKVMTTTTSDNPQLIRGSLTHIRREALSPIPVNTSGSIYSSSVPNHKISEFFNRYPLGVENFSENHIDSLLQKSSSFKNCSNSIGSSRGSNTKDDPTLYSYSKSPSPTPLSCPSSSFIPSSPSQLRSFSPTPQYSTYMSPVPSSVPLLLTPISSPCLNFSPHSTTPAKHSTLSNINFDLLLQNEKQSDKYNDHMGENQNIQIQKPVVVSKPTPTKSIPPITSLSPLTFVSPCSGFVTDDPLSLKRKRDEDSLLFPLSDKKNVNLICENSEVVAWKPLSVPSLTKQLAIDLLENSDEDQKSNLFDNENGPYGMYAQAEQFLLLNKPIINQKRNGCYNNSVKVDDDITSIYQDTLEAASILNSFARDVSPFKATKKQKKNYSYNQSPKEINQKR